MLLAAVVWTQWMAVAVAGLVVTVTIAIAIGYLIKVERPKYPPRNAKRYQ